MVMMLATRITMNPGMRMSSRRGLFEFVLAKPLARRAAVPHLVLTHLIPAPTSEAGRAVFDDDVRTGGYAGRVTVGEDLTTVVLGDS